MSLLVVDNVTLSFGDRAIVDEFGLRVSNDDRIGLIGPNGSGKTTILRLIAGEQQPDKGAIHSASNVRIGYLPQDLIVAGGKTLADFVLSSVPGRGELDSQLEAVEAELEQAQTRGADDEELMELAARIADTHERIDHFARHYTDHQAFSILAGLGFQTSDHDRDVSEFSGGWQMRAVLSALLFQQPDVLLLDEPTNHLDLPSVGWFSSFLKSYKRAFVLISHDREFLNEQISRVVSIEPEGTRSYVGNYEQYVKQRAEEEIILENQSRNLAREREHMEKFVTRFRAQANKAKAVQSRVKKLAKMDDVVLYQKRRVMKFTFPPTERAVGEVVRVQKLDKAYGDNVIFKGLDITVRRGDKIAIIGVNGAGKTTLLKMIAGELKPDAGEIKIGSKVTPGYYAQHHADTLSRESTAYDEVSRANPDALVGRVRSVLGAFLFSGDDVEKSVSVLSGGERARVALARLLINPGNLLLMDEPTNHLDLQSSESLAESLKTYDGTLVFVSHNRSLIRTLADQIWYIDNGEVERYPGSLDEYLYSSSLRGGPVEENASTTNVPVTVKVEEKNETRAEQKERKRQQAELRKKRSKLLNPLKERVETLERRIAKIEETQKERSAKLSDPAVYDDASLRNELLNSFQKDQNKLEELTARWESAAEKLDEAEAEVTAAEEALN